MKDAINKMVKAGVPLRYALLKAKAMQFRSLQDRGQPKS